MGFRMGPVAAFQPVSLQVRQVLSLVSSGIWGALWPPTSSHSSSHCAPSFHAASGKRCGISSYVERCQVHLAHQVSKKKTWHCREYVTPIAIDIKFSIIPLTWCPGLRSVWFSSNSNCWMCKTSWTPLQMPPMSRQMRQGVLSSGASRSLRYALASALEILQSYEIGIGDIGLWLSYFINLYHALSSWCSGVAKGSQEHSVALRHCSQRWAVKKTTFGSRGKAEYVYFRRATEGPLNSCQSQVSQQSSQECPQMQLLAAYHFWIGFGAVKCALFWLSGFTCCFAPPCALALPYRVLCGTLQGAWGRGSCGARCRDHKPKHEIT
jgi:hypothetical protein